MTPSSGNRPSAASAAAGHRPDDATLEAWLDGAVPPADAERIERYFETHPDALGKLDQLTGLDATSVGLLRDFSEPRPPERGVGDLVERLKASLPTAASETDAVKLLTPSDSEDLLGTLGHYEVLQVIASGAMGIVFRARDPGLDRLAALKVLAPELAANDAARTRFLREAHAIAAIEHPSILPVYGIYEGGGRDSPNCPSPWFAMRYAAGGSLDDRLRLDPATVANPDFLVPLARQITSALACAHAAGIVHRDLKPANIVLDEAGTHAWICDFGIAQVTDQPGLTYAGSVAGTPLYMSPEQVSGAETGPKSDLFSLGALLFHCACGRPPFEAATTASVMHRVASERPAATKPTDASTPGWFLRLIGCLLQKDPDARPPSAEAVLGCIDDRKAPRSRATRLRMTAAVILLATALVAGLLVRLPSVADSVNRIVAARLGNPFLIEGRIASAATLADAVRRARPGETITVRSNATHRIEKPVEIGSAGLRIRAADGFTPVFQIGCPEPAAIVSNGDLSLERLTLVRHLPHAETAVIHLRAGTLRLRRCAVTCYGSQKSAAASHAIRVDSGSRLEIDDSYVITVWTIPIAVQGQDGGTSTHIRLSNCAMSGIGLISLASDADDTVEIDLSRCTLGAPVGFATRPDSVLPRTVVTCERSVLNGSGSVWWLPGQSAQTFEEKVRWVGTDTLFGMPYAFVRNGRFPDRRDRTPLVSSLAEWQKLPNVRSVGEKSARLWPTTDSLATGEIDARVLEAFAAPFLAAYPGIGCEMSVCGP